MSLPKEDLVGAMVIQHRSNGVTYGTVNLISDDGDKVHLIWSETGGGSHTEDLPLMDWSCETLPSGQVELKRKRRPEKGQQVPHDFSLGFTITP